MKDFAKFCTPAKIYFAIAVIATVFDLLNGATMMYAFWQIVFASIWTFVLGWLCDKGYTSISWFLVLLPFLMVLAMFNIYDATQEQRQMMSYGNEPYSNRRQALEYPKASS